MRFGCVQNRSVFCSCRSVVGSGVGRSRERKTRRESWRSAILHLQVLISDQTIQSNDRNVSKAVCVSSIRHPTGGSFVSAQEGQFRGGLRDGSEAALRGGTTGGYRRRAEDLQQNRDDGRLWGRQAETEARFRAVKKNLIFIKLHALMLHSNFRCASVDEMWWRCRCRCIRMLLLIYPVELIRCGAAYSTYCRIRENQCRDDVVYLKTETMPFTQNTYLAHFLSVLHSCLTQEWAACLESMTN